MKHEPEWKIYDCPTCDSKAGQSCGRQHFGGSWWERCSPHAARKQLAFFNQWEKIVRAPLDSAGKD